MKSLFALQLAVFVPLGRAVQPGASSPPTDVTIRDLEFGELNFLHTTDTHGWHAGHLQQGSYSADWGDYITFSSLLREKLEADGKDLIVVDSGDRIRGNGLYGADPEPGNWTYRIFQGQDLDALTIGNHELYFSSTSDYERKFMVPYYEDEYLLGNIEIATTPPGRIGPPDWELFSPLQFKKITTRKNKINVTAIGMVYDSGVIPRNNPDARVIPVKTMINTTWFKTAIRSPDVDVFVIVGHVPAKPVPNDRYAGKANDTEFKVIHDAIRNCNCSNSNKPIHFFGGDYHIREYRQYDNRSAILASGMYFETVGFASMKGITAGGSNDNVKYFRRYIDNNVYSFQHHTGVKGSDFTSKQGVAISNLITEARTKLELDTVLGCAPRNLWMTHKPFENEHSLYRWLSREVFRDGKGPPERDGKFRMMMLNTGSMRYDVYQGEFTRDTAWSILPFESPLVYIPDVPWAKAKGIPDKLNPPTKALDTYTDDPLDSDNLMAPHVRYQEIKCRKFGDFGFATQAVLNTNDDDDDNLPLGYVTSDGLDDEGDDTVHSPMYNCPMPKYLNGTNFDIEKDNPAVIDLVFNDYLTKTVLPYLPGYTADDVKKYGPKGEGDQQEMRDFIADWVAANWLPFGTEEKPCEPIVEAVAEL